ncbi:P2Y purinoceptor 2-like [Salminus brasiliensis]|uniref:P2Y purinoceptor 2-like n=1 Tax=Salminus brasiliensis TaxID=930266 RepID=UPI003B839BAE
MTTSNLSTFANSSAPYRCKFNEDFKYILLPTAYGVVFVVGLLLNITAMYAILFRIKQWSPNTIYMINLTVCDTLYILTLPFLIYYYADKDAWPFTESFCKLIRFLFYANLYGSILFLSCISLHRFLGVCHPVRSMHWVSPRRARLVSVAIWTVVLVFQAPVLYFSRTRSAGNDLVCHDTTTEELFNHFLVYSSVISVLFFMIPFVVVLVCNGLMVRKLLESNTIGGATSQRSKKKSVKMIIIVLLTFMLCFLPFHLTRSLYYLFRHLNVSCGLLEGSSIAYKVTRPLASANSCIDPILYFMAGQGFRRSMNKKGKKGQRIDKEKYLSTPL